LPSLGPWRRKQNDLFVQNVHLGYILDFEQEQCPDSKNERTTQKTCSTDNFPGQNWTDAGWLSERFRYHGRVNKAFKTFIMTANRSSPVRSSVPGPPLQFSPKQVATSLSVSESSVKRWCDQGAIPTIRTVGGHRRITLKGLREFLQASNRTVVDPRALGIDESDLAVAGQAPVRRQPIPGEGQEPTQQEFRAALAEGDEDRCMEMLQQRLALGWSRAEAAEDLITDAMRGIGVAWDCGEVEVYQERRSCTICARLIHNLRESLPEVGERAPVAIGAAPESDPYQLPTALVELALRERRWNAINLGNDLPLDSLIQAVRDYRPKIVWLSVTSIDDPSRFVREQNKLADALGDEVPLIVGGRALDDGLRPKLRYTAHCDGLRHLVELAGILQR
jgi:excisionase family DNA binding protein